MRRVRTFIHAYRASVASGFFDFAALFSWRGWLGGWFIRIVAQVTFFALIGRLVGSPQLVGFLILGNVGLVAATAGLLAIAGAATDIRAGTLPLLVATPAPPAAAFAGRGFYVVADAIVTAFGALLVVAPVFDMPISLSTALRALPLLASIAFSSYALGTFLTAVVIHLPSARNLALNLTIAVMSTICGVNFALAALPSPLAAAAHLLPLTNGLIALRGLFAGDPSSGILASAAAELAVAAGWLGCSLAVFELVIARDRRSGAIDFG